MILCERTKFIAPHQVRPRIPDMRDLGHRSLLRPPETSGNDGRPHPGQTLIAFGRSTYPAVRLLDNALEGVLRGHFLECVYGHPASDLPGLEATNTVGDREERLVVALTYK